VEYKKIKNTDLELSVLGTGCWIFGGGEYWGALDQKDANDVVHASVANGINYFDTAEVYNEGRSESSLGEAIKGVPRDKIIIGSKVGPSNAYASTLVKHCEDSLRRLGTDYIDIYMLHWPIHAHSIRHFTGDEQIINNPAENQEAFGAMQLLQKSGKIRYIGVSNFSARRLIEDIPDNIQVPVNQLPYNLLCRAIEYETLPYCSQNNIGVIGYMTLFQGILTGKYSTLADVPVMQRRTRHFNSTGNPKIRHGEQGYETETAAALERVSAISQKHGITMLQLAIRWSVYSGITCALAGARNGKQMEANLKALDIQINEDIFKELNEATDPLKDKLGNHFDLWESRENDRTK